MKASAKLCVVMNAIGRGAKLVTLTHGSHHDTHLLHAGPWMKGRLLIASARPTTVRDQSPCALSLRGDLQRAARPVASLHHQLPPEMMRAEHMTAVYAARWEVELLFRELKKSYRIEQTPSKSRHVAETLTYAALLTLVVSRALQRALCARWKADPWRTPIDRWAVLVATVAQQLLALITSRRNRKRRAARIEIFVRATWNSRRARLSHA